MIDLVIDADYVLNDIKLSIEVVIVHDIYYLLPKVSCGDVDITQHFNSFDFKWYGIKEGGSREYLRSNDRLEIDFSMHKKFKTIHCQIEI